MLIVAFAVSSGLAAAAVAVPTPPTAPLEASGGASFRVGSAASATVTYDGGSVTEGLEIRSVDKALAVLADRRLASIWPDILVWGGPRLEALRDNRIAAAREVARLGRRKEVGNGLDALVRPQLRATLFFADALWDAGKTDEAETLVEHARGLEPRRTLAGPSEWAATSIWLASTERARGRFAEAAAILEAADAPVAADQVKTNLDINRALNLLYAGRPADALQLVDNVETRFTTSHGHGLLVSYPRVKGSERQFAWIRACALTRLGRPDDANVAAAPLNTDVEPTDKRFVIATTVKLRRQLAHCSGDVGAAAQAYADAIRSGPPGDDALLELQPRFASPLLDPAFMAAVRQHPVLAPLLAERLRILPDELVPALNGWRTAAQN